MMAKKSRKLIPSKPAKVVLEQSEKLIQSVFHTADIGLAVVDAKGKFVMVNTGFSRMLGYKKGELIGKPYYVILAHDKKEKDPRMEGNAIQGKRRSFAHRVVSKEGKALDVFITNNVFKDINGKKYMFKTMRDVTDERKYKELMASAEKSMQIGSFEFTNASQHITWTDQMYALYEVRKGFVPTVNSARRYINKEDLSRVDAAYQHLARHHEAVDFEFRIITPKRNEKWLHARMYPMMVNSKYIGFRGTLMDISERKYAEMEIERLSWVARHTNNSVIIADRHDRIEWVNDSFETRLGYSLSEINGKIPARLLGGPDTDKSTLKKIRSRLNQCQPVNEVILLYSREKMPIWFNVNIAPIFNAGELIHYIGILTDLTELVNAKEIQKNQESLEQRQKLLNAMAGNFPDGIIGVINRNLQYVFVGGSELKRLGHDIKDWIGHELFDKISPEANAKAAPFLNQVFAGEPVRFELEVRHNIYSVSAVPMMPEDHLTTRALVVIQNITDRKKAEEETLRALMKQKELNELKSKFVSVASHEFRTPLGTILSSADLVAQYVQRGDAENTQKHIARIKSSVNNLTSILNEFLSLSNIEEGMIQHVPVECDVQEFCENLLEEMQSLKKADQKFIYRCEGLKDTVMLDRQHTRNILINLISNAIKYSPTGKTITLTSVVEPGTVNFIVQDEGIGIPEEDKPNIFEAFFRAHNAAHLQGTGLGLNIIKRYLKIMKGSVAFESELNKGTTFRITLPLA
jgi:PAS domain S-box-containing protein